MNEPETIADLYKQPHALQPLTDEELYKLSFHEKWQMAKRGRVIVQMIVHDGSRYNLATMKSVPAVDDGKRIQAKGTSAEAIERKRLRYRKLRESGYQFYKYKSRHKWNQ